MTTSIVKYRHLTIIFDKMVQLNFKIVKSNSCLMDKDIRIRSFDIWILWPKRKTTQAIKLLNLTTLLFGVPRVG